MMLDALSKPPPSDAAAKSGARSGKGEGGTEGFSGALSSLGREPGRGNSSASGQGGASVDGASGEDVSANPKPDGQRPQMDAGLLDEAMGQTVHAAKRFSIRDALSSVAVVRDGSPARSSTRDIASAILQPREKDATEAEPAGKDASNTAAMPADDALQATSAGAGDGSDVLNLLAGIVSQASGAGANGADGVQQGGGRKADANGNAVGKGREAVADNVFASSQDDAELPSSGLDADAPADRKFRFTNAKGGGLNQELTQAVNMRERSTDAKASAAGTENVTVLEARRFIGLAPASNSASLLASLVGDADWHAAMQPGAALGEAGSSSTSGSVVHMLKLQMNPHALGSVTATLRLVGEALHVHLTVETRAAYRQLSDDSSGMLDALRAQGFSVDQVSINIASTSDVDSRGQQGAQTGQQMAGNGGNGNPAQAREQSDGRFAAEMNEDAGASHDTTLDDTAASRPVGPRAGQLYL